MPSTGREHPLALDKENLMGLWICAFERTVVAIEMVVKEQYSFYQLAVLSRRVRYALTTSGVATEWVELTSPRFH